MKAVFVLVLLTLIFFYQVFLGAVPIPADLITGGYYPWLDYKWGTQTGVPVKNPILTDAVSIIYPLRLYTAELLKRGEMHLWNPLMFTGHSLLSSLLVGMYFPSLLLYLILPGPTAWSLQVASQVLMGSIFMYIFVRHLKLARLASLFSAISYGFGGFSLIWLEINSPVAASAFLPLLLFLEDKFITTGKTKWGVVLSIALTLQIFAGYSPVVVFTLLAMLVWFLCKFSFRSGFKLAVFILLGFGLASILLVPGFELLANSQRLYETIDLKGVFVPIQYLVSFIAPDFFGNPATGNFWGVENYLNVAMYTGLIAFTLAIVGARQNLARSEVKILLTLALVVLVIVFSNPLSKFLYQLGIWGGSSVTMNRALFVINFCVAGLAGFGLNQMSLKNFRNYLSISLGLLGVILVSLILTRANLVSFRNLILPLVFIILFQLSLLIWKISKRNNIISILAVILLVMELFRFGWKYNVFSPAKYLYPKTDLTSYLQLQKNSRFVADPNIVPPNMWVPYHLQSMAGYDSFYPQDIAKVIAVTNSNNLSATPQTKNGVVTTFNSRLLDITGTNLVIMLNKEKNPIFTLPRFSQAFNYKSVTVFKNNSALPRAYLTSKVVKLDRPEILKTLIDPSFPAQDISLSEDIGLDGTTTLENIPDYNQISSDHVQVKTESPVQAMLVVLDSYYPGWQATIDSLPTKIYKVNYMFRGVLTPSGAHTVDFYYRPKSWQIGAIISLVSGLILAVIAFPFWLHRPADRRRAG